MSKSLKRTLSKIITAIAGTIALITIILAIEVIFAGEKTCHPTEAWILCQIRESTLLSMVEGFSILVAVLLFFLETPERDKQAHYEAWKVIDSAYGLKSSYARLQALQDLNEDRVSLRGLNVPEADLRGINLANVDLSNADLSGADLRFANLSNADLSNTNLTEANLSNANLSNAQLNAANLAYCDFIEADLQNVDFVGANLLGANFVRANLDRAYLGDVNLSESIFKDATVKQTKFFGVENLTIEQIKSTCNWQEAIFDTMLLIQLGLRSH
jgi:BTB/POZ domain-containing protein KCTD9